MAIAKYREEEISGSLALAGLCAKVKYNSQQAKFSLRMTFQPFQGFVFTRHALQEMTRRGISSEQVEQVLENPEQIAPVRSGRVVCQPRVFLDEPPKEYLLWVFVDVDESPPRVVTVYRTSKAAKYWRQT